MSEWKNDDHDDCETCPDREDCALAKERSELLKKYLEWEQRMKLLQVSTEYTLAFHNRKNVN